MTRQARYDALAAAPAGTWEAHQAACQLAADEAEARAHDAILKRQAARDARRRASERGTAPAPRLCRRCRLPQVMSSEHDRGCTWHTANRVPWAALGIGR